MRTVAYHSFLYDPLCAVGEDIFIPETSPIRREMLSLRTTLTTSLNNICVCQVIDTLINVKSNRVEVICGQ